MSSIIAIQSHQTETLVMRAILGLSAFYHDSAAALLVDGRIVAAAQEERFTRLKHDASFPLQATSFCLRQAGLEIGDLTDVVFYEKPLLKFERLLETYVAFAPRGFKSFQAAMPRWMSQKLFIPREIQRSLGGDFDGEISFASHHSSHAASAFYPSPFRDAAILTLDGVGEWTTTSWGTGRENEIEIRQEIQFPHSIGLLYSAFTSYIGFEVNSGEYKVMGLAPYGRPVFARLIRENLIDLMDDGSFWLNMDYFDYCAGLRMTNNRFHELFGGPPRKPESVIRQRDKDLAASIQLVTEEIILNIARYIRKETKLPRLCLSGGVALNCVANGRLQREAGFDDIWVQPAAGDDGGALGAALYQWHHIKSHPRQRPVSISQISDDQTGDQMNGCLLGPRFSLVEIIEYLTSVGAVFDVYEKSQALAKAVARLISDGQIVGIFQGRMEFGPRALGSRSIVADARIKEMQTILNSKIKRRESFRPFAPSCLEESVSANFETVRASPYMLFTIPVTDKAKGLPAITHIDGSARIQTVNRERNGWYYELLSEFKNQTGCDTLLNTSFNVRGEPIVCQPSEALRCFMTTDMDALVLENCLLLKSSQKLSAKDFHSSKLNELD